MDPFLRHPERPVWRLSVPPRSAAQVIARLGAQLSGERAPLYYFDWGGGLIWLAQPQGVGQGDEGLRSALADCGGHATLIRTAEEAQAATPVFQPLDPAKARLTERVKDSFDPQRILNPGRMYAGL